MLVQDFAKIKNLIQAGVINSVQGQDLKKQVLKKAFDVIVQSEKSKRLSSALVPEPNNSGAIQPINKAKALEDFSKNNPDFFNSDGRKEVLDFFSEGKAKLTTDIINLQKTS